jgi:hypothetical protein
MVVFVIVNLQRGGPVRDQHASAVVGCGVGVGLGRISRLLQRGSSCMGIVARRPEP